MWGQTKYCVVGRRRTKAGGARRGYDMLRTGFTRHGIIRAANNPFLWLAVVLAGVCAAAGAFEWDVQQITPHSASYSPSLAFGSDGTPHIAYFDKGGSKMRYAYRAAGVWHIETIQDMGG